MDLLVRTQRARRRHPSAHRCWSDAPVRRRGRTGSSPYVGDPRSSVSCAAVTLRARSTCWAVTALTVAPDQHRCALECDSRCPPTRCRHTRPRGLATRRCSLCAPTRRWSVHRHQPLQLSKPVLHDDDLRRRRPRPTSPSASSPPRSRTSASRRGRHSSRPSTTAAWRHRGLSPRSRRRRSHAHTTRTRPRCRRPGRRSVSTAPSATGPRPPGRDSRSRARRRRGASETGPTP